MASTPISGNLRANKNGRGIKFLQNADRRPVKNSDTARRYAVPLPAETGRPPRVSAGHILSKFLTRRAEQHLRGLGKWLRAVARRAVFRCFGRESTASSLSPAAEILGFGVLLPARKQRNACCILLFPLFLSATG